MQRDNPSPLDVATGHSIGPQLCNALGLDPSRVSKLVITAEAGEPVTVKVTQPVLQTQGLALCRLITTTMELTERGDVSHEDVRLCGTAPD